MHLMNRTPHTALLSVLLIVCAIIYLPGLQGDFIYDDFSSLLVASAFNDTEAVTLSRVLAEHTSGPTGRPLSMASFYASYQFAGGFDARSFKAAGLAIHLLNGLLLYLLASRLLRASIKDSHRANSYALIIAAIWLLHPLHVSTVMYVVQRMTLLATMFLLLGLLTYVIGRDRIVSRKPYGHLVLAISLLCMPAAILSKEIGALQGLLAFVLEWFILAPANPARERKAIRAYFGMTIILPVLVLGIALLAGKANFFSYGGRPFTLLERLMTEARVVLEYMRWIVVPDIQQYGLFHDDVEISTGLASPPTTILAIASLALVGMATWFSRKRWPLIAGGVAFFFVGHGLESTVLPLLLAFEHRNYLPSAGLILSIVALLGYLQQSIRRRWLVTGLTCMVVAMLAFATLTRTMIWGNPLAHALSEISNHPNSAQAHSQAATIYNAIATTPSLDEAKVEHYARKALQHLDMASRLSPGSATYRINILRLRSVYLTSPSSDEVNSISTFLQHTSPEPATGWQVHALVECGLAKDQCKITSDDLRKIIQGSLNNRRIVGSSRASILVGLAAIENATGNTEQVIDAYQQAIQAASNKNPYQLALTKYLLDIGLNDQAATLLETIRSSKRARAYQTDIEVLARRLRTSD